MIGSFLFSLHCSLSPKRILSPPRLTSSLAKSVRTRTLAKLLPWRLAVISVFDCLLSWLEALRQWAWFFFSSGAAFPCCVYRLPKLWSVLSLNTLLLSASTEASGLMSVRTNSESLIPKFKFKFMSLYYPAGNSFVVHNIENSKHKHLATTRCSAPPRTCYTGKVQVAVIVAINRKWPCTHFGRDFYLGEKGKVCCQPAGLIGAR